jgi:peptidoglycan/xylan/chitin deacetylase (PgdA/CDA1 family)
MVINLFHKNQTIRVNKSYSFSSFRTAEETNNIYNNYNSTSGNRSSIRNKVVILNFYDDVKSQFTNAKPILDKYGFKGTFFIVCNWAGAVRSQLMMLLRLYLLEHLQLTAMKMQKKNQTNLIMVRMKNS